MLEAVVRDSKYGIMNHSFLENVQSYIGYKSWHLSIETVYLHVYNK